MEGSYAISFRFSQFLANQLVPHVPFSGPFDIWDQFLAEHKINVLKRSMGLHTEECATPHFHYHLVCSNTFPFKSPPTQAFKNKYKNNAKLFKDNPNSLSIKVTAYEPTDPAPDMGVPEEERSPQVASKGSWETFYRRFLNYPLKEKKSVSAYCRGINIEKASLEGHAEWQAVKTYRAKLKARKLAEETKKGLLYAHLDNNNYNITGLHGVVRDTLNFYKGNKDAPHPCYQVKSAEIYAYHKGIWNIDDIIKRYLGKDTSIAASLDSLGISY